MKTLCDTYQWKSRPMFATPYKHTPHRVHLLTELSNLLGGLTFLPDLVVLESGNTPVVSVNTGEAGVISLVLVGFTLVSTFSLELCD